MKNELNHVHQLIEQYLGNTITAEDRVRLMKLVKSGEIDELLKDGIGEAVRERIRSKDSMSVEEQMLGNKIFESIVGNGHSRHKRFTRVLGYAASLAAILVVGFIFVYQNPKTTSSAPQVADAPVNFVTVKNESTIIKRITLQDGSTVVLEPSSEIRYHKDFKNDRQVYLSGEAFFEVTKDASHPFYVYANEVTTKVLGTSFLVKANNKEKEIVVAVKTGKVSVSAKLHDDKSRSAATQEITLTPNQQAIYKRQEHVVVKKVVEEPSVIVEQKAIKNNYVNEEIVVILRALSESYGVAIRYDEQVLSGCTLTSDIIESEGLYDQLDIICSALGGSYTLENDASIVINSAGCK
jgi:transmembrane sensor